MTTEPVMNRKVWEQVTGGSTTFSLFEGVCPTCLAEVKLIRWGGTASFLEDSTMSTEVEPDRWNEIFPEWDDGFGEDGCVEFECPNGHTHYIGHYPLSGWSDNS